MRWIWLLLLSFSAHAANWPEYWDGRYTAIKAHQDIAGSPSAMAIGDSITEQQGWWNLIGNCRLINAGFGGITAKALAERVGSHIPGKPRYVWLQVGTNTANKGRPEDEYLQYEQHLLTIIHNLQSRGTRVILVSIPPIDKNKATAQQFSRTRINNMNSIMYWTAQRLGLYFVNLNYDFMDLDPGSENYGYAYPWVTGVDGVHLSPQANAIIYYHRQASLNNQVHVTGVPCWG